MNHHYHTIRTLKLLKMIHSLLSNFNSTSQVFSPEWENKQPIYTQRSNKSISSFPNHHLSDDTYSINYSCIIDSSQNMLFQANKDKFEDFFHKLINSSSFENIPKKQPFCFENLGDFFSKNYLFSILIPWKN